MKDKFYKYFLFLFSLLFFLSASANPALDKINSGNVSISQTKNATTIRQSSDKAIINWNSFNIGAGEKTQFIQPGRNSVALNRINPNQGVSQIYGSLSANGRIILINSAGIFFGPSSSVNVASLIASTKDISNANFLSGKYSFDISSSKFDGKIENQGKIIAANHGLIALIGNNVENNGLIQAEFGSVILASGSKFTFDLYGDQLINFSVDAPGTATASIKNSGSLVADGGKVLITANAAENVLNDVIDMDGVAQANSVGNVHGEIVLSSTESNGQAAGNVSVNGSLQASGKNKGSTGGTVKVVGRNITLTSNAVVDVSGDAGGGVINVGGSEHGSGPLPNASTTSVNSGAVLNANALTAGNGGSVIVWSNNNTAFAGSITAQGGAVSGNGGFVETSGGYLNIAGGSVNTLAPHGSTGMWLLDPTNVTICNSSSSPSCSANVGNGGASSYTSSAGTSYIFTGTDESDTTGLQYALDQSNITITTSYSGTGSVATGSITVAAPVAWSSSNTLTLQALGSGNDTITINSNGATPMINATGGGSLTLQAGLTGGTITINGGITLSGAGTLTVSAANIANSITTGSNGAINVGNFVLSQGEWTQNSGTLPTFSVSNSFSIASGTAFNGAFNAEFLRVTGGDGSSGTPYQIADVYGLQGMATDSLSANYIQSGTFSAAVTSNWNSAAGFVSIGTNANPFTGSFNGANYTISGLTINNTTSASYSGLFGKTGSASQLSNIILSGATVSGGSYVGALAGSNAGSIQNVTITSAAVTGVNYVGGMVGANVGASGANQATIQNSSSSGTVTDSTTGGVDVGGLVGYNSGAYSIITSSSSSSVLTTSIHAGGSAGGLVGLNGGTITGTITAPSYATGSVTSNAGGASNFGGLVGSNTGSVSYAYSSGTVFINSNNNSNIGGLVGTNNSTGSLSNVYTVSTVQTFSGGYSGGNSLGGLVGLNSGSINSGFRVGYTFANEGYAGGLVGQNTSTGTINNSYVTGYLAVVPLYSNNLSGIGGLVGLNAGTVNNSYAALSFIPLSATNVGAVVGSNTGTVNNTFWDSQVMGTSTGVGSGTALNGGGAGTFTGSSGANLSLLSTYQSGSGYISTTGGATAWSIAANASNGSSTWGIIGSSSGASYPYLSSFYSTTPVAISGLATTDGSTAVATATTVTLAANTTGSAGGMANLATSGLVVGTAYTGANGFYYLLEPSSFTASGNAILTYITGTNLANAVDVYSSSNNALAGMNLTKNQLLVGDTTGSLANGALSNAAIANAYINSTDNVFTASGNNITLNTNVNLLTTNNATESFTINGTITGPASGNIGGNVNFQSPVILAQNTSLNAGSNTITFGSTINGAYTLSLTSGTNTLAGNIGGTTALTSLTLSGGGTDSFTGTAIKTTGNQIYNDTLTIGNTSTTTFTTTGTGTNHDISLSAVSWSGSNTLSLVSGNNIYLNGNIYATSTGTSGGTATGGLTLSAVNGTQSFTAGSIGAGTPGSAPTTITSNIIVNNFTLSKGQWLQNATSLPTFTVGNSFQITSGTAYNNAFNAQFTRINSTGGNNGIQDVYGLQGMATDSLSSNYIQTQSFSASGTSTWSSGTGFIPIGSSTAFSGQFNGNGYTISNLYDSSSAVNIGLFAATTSVAILSNMNLTNVNMTGTGNGNVGALVGANAGTITNSSSSGAVNSANTITTDGFGGLVGNNSGVITSSSSAVTVTSTMGNGYNLGGLVGYNTGTINGTSLLPSYSTGTVTESTSNNRIYNLGGLVGYNAGAVNYAYSTSLVEYIAYRDGGSAYNEGGLIGQNNGGTVTNVYSAGTLLNGTLTNNYVTNVGGLIGLVNNALTLDGSGSGFNSSGCTSSICSQENVNTSGHLSGVGGLIGSVANSGTIIEYVSTSGTIGGSNAGGLVGSNSGTIISSSSSASITGGGNNMGGLVGANTSTGVIEGTSLAPSYSTGIMTIGSGTAVGGLVGLNSGTVNYAYSQGNITLSQGTQDVGGLIGENSGGIVTNVYSKSNIVATSASYTAQSLGGLIGQVDTTALTLNGSGSTFNSSGCVGSICSMGSLTYTTISTLYVGGLIGNIASSASGSLIENISNTSPTVQGRTSVGGLVGANNGATISNASISANVIGSGSYIGGLVGDNTGSITGSFSTGSVTETGATQSSIGGFVGYNESGATISDSYTQDSVKISGTAASQVGGFAGANAGTISNTYSAAGFVPGTATTVGGFVGSNTGTINNSFWDTATSGQSTGVGSGTALSGGGGGTFNNSSGANLSSLSSYQSAGWSIAANASNGSSTWGIIGSSGGASYPYLSSFYSATPVAISGLATTDGTTAVTAGTTVNLAVNTTGLSGGMANVGSNGLAFGTASTANNGFYYFLEPSTVLSNGNAVLTYITGTNAANALDYYASTNAAITGLNLTKGFVNVGDTNGTLAAGNLSNALVSIAYLASGSLYTASSNNISLNAATSIATASNANESFTINGTITGPASGNIGGNVNFQSSVILAQNTSLNAGTNTITFGSTINGAYTLSLTSSANTLAANVGGTTALTSMTLSGSGTDSFTGTAITTTGNQIYNDALTIGNASTTTFTTTGTGANHDISLNAVSWTGSNSLSLVSGNNIYLNGNIYATSTGTSGGTATGGLTLSAVNGTQSFTVGSIGAGTPGSAPTTITANIIVNNFTLNAGQWLQNATSLPTFTVGNNFQIASGTAYNNAFNAQFTRINSTGGNNGIQDVYGLQGIATDSLSASYIQTQAFNAAVTTNWNSGSGFVPIGHSTAFSGAYNGQGFTISNLVFNWTNSLSNDGLFGQTGSAANLSNINLTGVSFITNSSGVTYSNVGMLVGSNAGTLTSDSASGSMTVNSSAGAASYVGGLVGYNSGSISSSSATTTLSASATYMGGLVGENTGSGTITSSSAAVTFSIQGSNTGGLVGYNLGSIQGTSNAPSYSTGTITITHNGTSNNGGLVGYSSGVLNYAYSTVNLTNTFINGTNFGGLIGQLAGGTVTNVYSSGSASTTYNNTNVGGLIGQISAAVTLDGSGGSFNNSGCASSICSITGSLLSSDVAGGLVGLVASSASGTVIKNIANSYGSVSNNVGLGAIGGLVGTNYGTITSSSSSTSVNTPGTGAGGLVGQNMSTGVINGTSVNPSFSTGTITGNSGGGLVGINKGTINYAYSQDQINIGATAGGLVGENSGGTITNVYSASTIVRSGTNSPQSNFGGLIGVIDTAPITLNGSGSSFNSACSGSICVLGSITAASGQVAMNSVGGLVGSIASTASGTLIENISLTQGSVSGGTNVGGLVGTNYGTIQNSFSSIPVNVAGGAGGGLVGLNNGTITSSFSTGTVTASGTTATSFGGLVGSNASTGTISNSYSMSTLILSGTSLSQVGGFVGTNAGTISNTYSAAGITVGTATTVGGFVGSNTGTINNSFWDTALSGQGTGVGSGTTLNGGGAGTFNGSSGANLSLLTTYQGGSSYISTTGGATAWSIAANASGSSTTWGILGSVGGASYPYLSAFYSTTPVAISGIATTNGSTAVAAGTTVNLATNVSGSMSNVATLGVQLGATTTANNGFYYFLDPSTVLSNGNAVLTYITGTNAANGVDYFASANGAITGLNLTKGYVNIGDVNETLTAGNLSNALLSAAYLASGSLYTASSNNISLNAATSIATASNANESFTINGTITGPASGNIGGNVNFQSPVILAQATTLNAGTNTITFGSTINGAYTLGLTSSANTFAGVVGGTAALTSLTLSGGGTDSITGTAITTTGNQIYNDTLTIGNTSTTTFTTTGTGANHDISLSAVSWTGSNTLSLVSGDNIYLNGNIYATSTGTSGGTATGGLTLSAVNGTQSFTAGSIGAGTPGSAPTTITSNIIVNNFTLSKGQWLQNATSLPTFTVGNSFQITSGTAYNNAFNAQFTRINSTGGNNGIQDVYGLQGIATDSLSAGYVQTQSFSASGTSTWSSGTGFIPIGKSTAFSGSYNGASYTISGLTFNYLNTATLTNIALIAQTSSAAQLSNINLTGVSLTINLSGSQTSMSNIAGLVGTNAGSISNSSTTGTINTNIYTPFGANATSLGGLVGTNSGTITSSNSGMSFSYLGTSTDVGGLVGTNTGTITGTSLAPSYTASGTALTGATGVGGLVGYNNGGTIQYAYSTENISIGKTNTGGLIGIDNGGSISNVYSTGTLTGNTSFGGSTTNVGGLIGLISGNVTLNGSGTNFGPCIGTICSTSSIGTGNSAQGMVNDGGLVGQVASGASGTIIENIYQPSTGIIYGDSAEGGVVGLNYGQIINVNSSMPLGITSFVSVGNVGGLVGANYGSISNSSSTGSVSIGAGGISNIGGFVGLNASGGTIQNSYTQSLVTTSTTVSQFGGFVGSNVGTISNSYSAAGMAPAGSTIVGGFAGTNTGTINNSFWDTAASGQSTGVGSGTALNGGGGGTFNGSSGANLSLLATYQSGSSYISTSGGATAWDITSGSTASVWGIVPGYSYPYLSAFYSTTPGVISGTATTNGSTAVTTGTTVSLASNHSGSMQTVGSVATGNNGFYYFLESSSSLSTGNIILTSITGTNAANGVDILTSAGSILGLNLTAKLVSVGDTASTATTQFSNTTLASAYLSGASLYTTSGNNITLAATTGIGSVANTNQSFNINGTITGPAAGNIAGNINFQSAVTLGQNTTLNVGSNAITFGSTIDGGYSLALTGTTNTLNGAIGGTTALTTLTLNGHANTLTSPFTLTSITVTGVGSNNTLQVGNGNATWNITGTNAGNLTSITGSTISGSFAFTNTQSIIGGTGTNTLKAANAAADTWTVNANNGGKLALTSGGTVLVNFTNMQTLTSSTAGDIFNITANVGTINGIGSSGHANTYNFTSGTVATVNGTNFGDTFAMKGGSITALNGGSGSDTVNYQTLSGAISVNLQTGAATNIGSLSGIESFIGDSNTANAFTGTNTASTWTINSSNSGSVNNGTNTVSFSSFPTINGGNGGDTFNVTSTMVAINGGSSNNIFNLGSGGNVTTLNGGSASNNALNATNASGSDAWTISGANAGALSGATAVSAFSAINTINGGSGSNTLTATNGSANTWAVNSANAGTLALTAGGNLVNFTNMQNITGSAASNIFNVGANISSITGVGSSGNANTFNLNAGTVTTVNGSNFNDSFNMKGGSVTTLNGGSGTSDTVSYQTLSGAISVNLQSHVATNIGSFSGIESFIGDSNSANAFTGTNTASTWTVSSSNSGSVNNGANTVSFSSFPIINGGNGGDTFNVTSTIGTINGGSSNNIFNLGSGGAVTTLSGGSASNNTLSATNASGSDAWAISGAHAGTLSGLATVSVFSGINNINGGSGSNTLTATNGGADTWAVSSANTGTLTLTAGGSLVNFTNMQNLVGSAASNIFNVGANVSSITGVGSSGHADTFNLNAGTVTTINGGNFNDRFNMAGASISTLNGGSGTSDAISYLSFAGAISVDLQNGTATNIGHFSGIEAFIGNGNSAATFTGTNTANTWTINSFDSGSVNNGSTNVSFNNFPIINGGNGGDTFNVSGTVDTINGGSSNNTFNLSSGGNVTTLNGGGASNNTLSATNPTGANTWDITGSGSGDLSGTSAVSAFNNIANIIGSSGGDIFNVNANISSLTGIGSSSHPNTFNFTSGTVLTVNGGNYNDTLNMKGGLITTLNGGTGTTVDYSNLASIIQVNLQTNAATDIGGFANVAKFVGDGNTGNAITGANTTTAWNITGTNAETVSGIQFVNFSNLTTGAGNNSFTFNNNSVGNLTLNAAGSASSTFTDAASAANITDSGTGSVIVNANITTTGTQAYGSPVVLNADAAFTGGALSFGNINGSSSGKNLTINSTGTADVSGTIGSNIQNLSINGASGDTGVVTLSGSSVYTGSTNVGFGTLKIASVSALPTATGITLQNNALLDLNGNSIAIGSLSSASASSEVLLGAITLTVGNDNTSTSFAGKLIGTTGGLTKIGAGDLTLTGNLNNYSGITSIQAGVLTQGSASAIPSTSQIIIGSNGSLGIGYSSSFAGLSGAGNVAISTGITVTLIGGNSYTLSGSLSGGGNLVITNGTIETLSGGNNNLTGLINIQSGELVVSGNNSNLGTVSVNGSGAALIINNVILNASSIQINGTGISNGGAIVGNGSATLNGNITLTGDAAINTPNITDSLSIGGSVDGAANLSFSGAGAISVSGAIGANTPLTSLTSNVGAMTLNGGQVTATGAEVFASAIQANNSLNFQASSIIFNPGSSVTSTGSQAYSAPVIINSDTVLTGSGITLSNGVSGNYNLSLIGTNTNNIFTMMGSLAVNSISITGSTTNANSLILQSPNPQKFAISSSSNGSVSGAGSSISFSNISNITGGTHGNTFTFANGASLRQIDGGNSSMSNTLDYSAYTTPITLSISGTQNGTISNSANSSTQFQNINNVISNGNSTLNIAATGKINQIYITGPLQGYVNDPFDFKGFNLFTTASNVQAQVTFLTGYTSGGGNSTTVGGAVMTFIGIPLPESSAVVVESPEIISVVSRAIYFVYPVPTLNLTSANLTCSSSGYIGLLSGSSGAQIQITDMNSTNNSFNIKASTGSANSNYTNTLGMDSMDSSYCVAK